MLKDHLIWGYVRRCFRDGTLTSWTAEERWQLNDWLAEQAKLAALVTPRLANLLIVLACAAEEGCPGDTCVMEDARVARVLAERIREVLG